VFHVVFQDAAGSSRPRPTAAELERWLTEWGEPCAVENPIVALRAVPARFEVGMERPVRAEVTIGPRTPISRLVAVLFDLSAWLGSDVCLEGGALTRAALWWHLADEQDRLRLATALDRAQDHGNRDEVLQRLWAFLSVIHPGQDLRWDAALRRVVQMLEVGDEVSTEEARHFRADARTGEVVGRPVGARGLHILAWRWLNDAYPGIAEVDLGSIWPR
jgi:hypothetical protein